MGVTICRDGPLQVRLKNSAALCRAWREGPEHPFLLDNVWDIIVLLDYLETRPDVDGARIGMTGLSLGGMHTWLAAALDDRIAVAAPMIGVQVTSLPANHLFTHPSFVVDLLVSDGGTLSSHILFCSLTCQMGRELQ